MRIENWEVTQFCHNLDGCADAVVHLIQMRLGGTGATEDVYQDTLLTAWEKRHTLTDDSKFKPWIMQIARNKCNDFFRSSYHKREVPTDPQVLAIQHTSQGRDIFAAEVPYGNSIWQAVAGLTPLQQEVVRLFYQQGLSIAAISKRTRSPTGTIKRRLHDARRSLKHQIRGDLTCRD